MKTTSTHSAASSGSQNKRSFCHVALNRWTVKKSNSSNNRGVVHGSVNTVSMQQHEAVMVSSNDCSHLPSTERERTNSPPDVEINKDPLITSSARPKAAFEKSTTLSTQQSDNPPEADAAVSSTLHRDADQIYEDDEAEDDDTRPLPAHNNIPKFLQRFSQCCPRHDELAANEKVLMIVFASFSMFTVSQFVLAFAANSLSLLGDTAALVVDCIDYAMNIVAERRKTRFDLHYQDPSPHLTPERAFELRERAKRKVVLFWEVVPPALSALCLVGVTIYVLEDSIRFLIQDLSNKPKADQNSVDLTLVLTLQLINLFIDILNFTCFAKIHRLRGFQTMHHQPQLTAIPAASVVVTENASTQEDVLVMAQPACKHGSCAVDEAENVDNSNSTVVPTSSAEMKLSSLEEGKATSVAVNSQQPEDCCTDCHDPANLNMCSAYTHVLADSMRTISILVAVTLALLIESVTAEAADSAAAVVVSVIILVTLVPLVRGLVAASQELWRGSKCGT